MAITPLLGEHESDSEYDEPLGQHRDVNEDFPKRDPNVPTIPGVNQGLVLAILASGIILAAADNTIVVASYGRIGSEFNELNRTSWISTAYLLTTASFQPLYGRLSNIYGRKPCLCFSYIIFGIGCLLCGTSQNIEQLIASRALSGIGGGGMTALASIIMSDIVPLRTRGTWQGVLNIIFGIGTASGGPVGGWLSDTVGWRWAFTGQVPITFMGVLMIAIVLHVPEAPAKFTGTNLQGSSTKAKLQRVDFTGAFTLTSAVSCLLISLDLSTNSINYRFTSPITQFLLIASILLFVAFYHIENSYAVEPFFPPALLRRREILAPWLTNFFCFATSIPVIFQIPLFYQAVLGSSATVAGQRLIPMVLGGMMGGICGGIYIQKTGRYYWLTFSSYLAQLLGVGIILICMMVTGRGPLEGTIVGFMHLGMIMFNSGVASGITALLIALISNVTSEEYAVVIAITYLFRSIGSAVALSFSALLVQNGLKRRLLKDLGNRNDIHQILMRVSRDLDYIRELNPDVAAVVRRSYQGGLSDALLFALVLALLCWMCSWALREVRVRK